MQNQEKSKYVNPTRDEIKVIAEHLKKYGEYDYFASIGKVLNGKVIEFEAK